MRDSSRSSGTGEIPQTRKRRGGSPPALRKASNLERKSTAPYRKATVYENSLLKTKFKEDHLYTGPLFHKEEQIWQDH